MSVVLLAAANAGQAIAVTRGNFASTTGWSSGGSLGSIVGIFLTRLTVTRAGALQSLYSDTAAADFAVRLTSVTPPSNPNFNAVAVSDDTGAVRVFSSASATFTSPNGTDSLWVWGTGSSPVWTSTVGIQTVTFI